MALTKEKWQRIDFNDLKAINDEEFEWQLAEDCDGFEHKWKTSYTYDKEVKNYICSEWPSNKISVRTRWDWEEGERIWILTYKHTSICDCENSDHLFIDDTDE